MSAVHRSRSSLVPLAVAAAAGAILLPAAIPNSAPSAFAAQVVSESQALAESAAHNVAASAATLLAQSPSLLKTLPLGDTASFLATPQSNAPLVTVLNGSSTAAASRALLGPALAAASDPTADLITALQSAIGKLSDAFTAAPTNIIKSAGQLLDGDLRTALQTFSNILIQPLVLIGLVDLPNIASSLSQLAPFFAPVINAFPDIAINIVVTNLQLFTNAREGVATIYEGIRDGLKAGDLGAAAASFVTGISNILAQGNKDLFGENGVVAALKQSGDDFLQAIGQLGRPATPSTDTLQVSNNVAAAPSTAEQSTQTSTTAAVPEATTTAPEASQTETPAAVTPATVTPAAVTAPESTKTDTGTKEAATAATGTTAESATPATASGTGAAETTASDSTAGAPSTTPSSTPKESAAKNPAAAGSGSTASAAVSASSSK